MRQALWITTLTAAAASAALAATERPVAPSLHCPGCTAAQAEARLQEEGVDAAFVYDLERCSLRKLATWQPPEAAKAEVHELPVLPHTWGFWERLCSLYAAHGSLTLALTVPAGLLGLGEYTAVDIVIASYARRDVLDALEAHHDALEALPEGKAYGLFRQADRAGLDLALEAHPASLRIAIEFPDGSRAAFAQPMGTESEPAYVPESARDASGNRIPEANAERYAGVYDFSANPDDASGWEAALRRFSVPIANDPSTRAECIWQQTSLSCTYR